MTALNPATLVITRYARRNRHLVRDLLARNFYSHTHLDWHESEHWIDSDRAPIRLAWLHGTLVGMMGVSEPLNQTGWIRLAAVQDQVDPGPVMSALWADIRRELIELGMHTVAMLMIRDWPIAYLRDLGFQFVEEVVTLRRSDQYVPPEATPAIVTLRSARADDVPAMAAVDHTAFQPPWQLATADIRQAEKIAANATVAVASISGVQKIVGYQISTLYFDGSHLARLAVDPVAQGCGIGAALTREVLRYFARRGVFVTTVNTQASNHVSQHLYQKLGFRHNGYDLPVWMIRL